MMRLALLLLVCAAPARAQVQVVTDDLDHFWIAFDAVTAEPDSAARVAIVEALYLAPGTPGLAAMTARRGYTAADYAHAIAAYPAFWASIRQNSARAAASAGAIREAAENLRALYPTLRPATVYVTVGALMTNGMTLDSTVFIGAELALADAGTPTHELPERLAANLRRYFDTDPVEHLPFLAVHEIVHTQQQQPGETLLDVSLYEGIAEYVAALATGERSPAPAVAFLRADPPPVLGRFAAEMYSPNLDDWLYNDTQNRFGVRDLGYAAGYYVAERRLARASDRTRALREMIDLDYADPQAVDDLVEESTALERDPPEMRADYAARQPTLAAVGEFENGARDVDPAVSTLTLTFSEPMDTRFRTFELGPLGEAHALRVQRVDGWSGDGRTLRLGVSLEPGRRYQLVVGSGFRAASGAALAPVLIDVSTRPE